MAKKRQLKKKVSRAKRQFFAKQKEKEEELAQAEKFSNTEKKDDQFVAESEGPLDGASIRQQLAHSCLLIEEDPQANVRKLRTLLGLINQTTNLRCKKEILLSLKEVFVDICPDYRIRLATEEEKTQKAKKETKQLREFESNLLSNYKQYLEILEKYLKAGGKLRKTALSCYLELLQSHPNFNFRKNIAVLVVPYSNSSDDEIRSLVCGKLKSIIRKDKDHTLTLEIVQLINRLVKLRKFKVKPQVLEILLSISIKEVESEADKLNRKEEKKKQMSRKDRKRKKHTLEIEKELEHAAVLTNKTKFLKINTEIVTSVFHIYFGILKNRKTSRALLPPCLEGLSKFAHLININFHEDLMRALSELSESEELDPPQTLHCVQTGLSLLSGQGSVLNIDPHRFYCKIYKTLGQLHACNRHKTSTLSLLKCLQLIKLNRQLSLQKLLGFAKRATTMALQQSPEGSSGLLMAIRSFLQCDPRSEILLDRSEEGGGIYRPDLDDPDHANAGSSNLYELLLLKNHYNENVRSLAKHLLRGAPSAGEGALPLTISTKTPTEMYELQQSSTF